MTTNESLKIGSLVRYIGPSLFASGANWTGEVVREPITGPRDRRRPTDECYLVQVGKEKRPRPMRAEYLQVVIR